MMEQYMLAQELADKKMAEAQKDYEETFLKYAKRHNIEIIDTQTNLSKKSKFPVKFFVLQRYVFIVFLAIITESCIFESLEVSDISGLQQNFISLATMVKEAREVINAIELYKNDKNILEATHAAFVLYLEEAEVHIPEMIDILLL